MPVFIHPACSVPLCTVCKGNSGMEADSPDEKPNGSPDGAQTDILSSFLRRPQVSVNFFAMRSCRHACLKSTCSHSFRQPSPARLPDRENRQTAGLATLPSQNRLYSQARETERPANGASRTGTGRFMSHLPKKTAGPYTKIPANKPFQKHRNNQYGYSFSSEKQELAKVQARFFPKNTGNPAHKSCTGRKNA